MPPIPFSPGVAQAIYHGTIKGNPWAIITHWQFYPSTVPWTATDLQTLVNTIQTATHSNLASHHGTDVYFGVVHAVDLSNATPQVADSTGTTFNGTGPFMAASAQGSVLVNKSIPARYRGGKPRSYYPGYLTTEFTDGENMTPTAQNNWNIALAAIATAIGSALPGTGSASCIEVVPRYGYTYTDDPVHHKWLKHKSTYITSNPISSAVVHSKLATQRRRAATSG
jgi:hypothetical protein